ncbi:prolyl 4-hydroxylase subunit alpha-1-like isoform X3 [Aricia agestis]|uniref:prolyl 4-hydroxylase subunit alpha-1-like isoform X3 n=1 Tax=Aricia agestis TaxID=91739 RepID=UPI001C207B16|nr:prolyl 4-hydroxylase subunit alpha-1-like isoform X3 [Aricia agestis]
MKKLCLLIFFFINSGVICRGELFTALSDLEPLLTTHKKVVEDLEDYINREEERLNTLKRYVQVYKREHVKAMEDIPNYIGNPINAFTLIKRMTTDLAYIKLNIDLGVKHARNISIMQYEDATYPSAEDLRGAARALTRLQETYLLKIEDLAEGILNGVVYGSAMNANDCFELGIALYYETEYRNSLVWMLIALKKYNEEISSYPLTEIDILVYITFANYMLGNVKEAEEWTKKIVAIDPTYDISKPNATIAEQERKKRRKGDTGEDSLEAEVKQTPKDLRDQNEIYKTLCRGEMDLSPQVAKELTCRYLTENHPFLRLAPIKMEYKYRNPDIVLFHEVLSDSEIQHLKELAQPRRAMVRDAVSDNHRLDYRISKTAALADKESPVIERVTRRIADFTGLDMDTAENLQVVNYGIGGHYLPHYDFATSRNTQFADEVGNRIATVLFYMSDVAQGGATVFMKLGLSLFPVRGAAAVWLNLHASGEGDLATRHAACPVLRGSKWVSNKWIHLVGQEFIKPCGLEYQPEGIKESLTRLVNKLI